MAYSKLWRGGTEAYGIGIGINTVNQLRANFEAMRDAMLAQHAMGQQRFSPPRAAFGTHNHQNAPRCSLGVEFAGAGIRVAELGASKIAWYAAYIGTGQLYVLLHGLSTYWVHAIPQQTTSATPRFVDRVVYSANQGADVCLYITTRELSGGDFVATSFNFGLTIYGT